MKNFQKSIKRLFDVFRAFLKLNILEILFFIVAENIREYKIKRKHKYKPEIA